MKKQSKKFAIITAAALFMGAVSAPLAFAQLGEGAEGLIEHCDRFAGPSGQAFIDCLGL